jgi:hypothetical protein
MRMLQRDAETLLRRTRTRARSLLNRERRRAGDTLFGQAQRLRATLEQQAQRTTRDLERRAERFRNLVGGEVTKRLRTLVRRLDLPSRAEMQRLGRRINDLEQALRRQSRRAATGKRS